MTGHARHSIPAKRWAAALAALLVALGAVFLAPAMRPESAKADHIPLPPQTLTYNVTFSTAGQSVWGPNGADLADKTVNFASTSWNESDTQSDIESFDAVFDTAYFGGEIGGSTSGQLGLEAKFTDIGPGSVDVTYPVQIKLDVPAIDSFRTGQTVTIGSNWTLQPGWSMPVNIPRGRVSIDGDMAVAASAFFNVCVWDCTGQTNFFPPIGLSYLNQSVASSDGQTLTIAGETVPYEGTDRKVISGASGFITGISGTFAPPDLHLNTVVGPDGKSLIASGSSPNFIDMDVNFTKFLKKLPGGQVLGVSLPTVAGVSFGAEVFDADSFIKVTQNQQVTFTPTIRVKLDFTKGGAAQAVQYTVKTPAGAVVESGNGASVTYDVGNKLDLVVPSLANGETIVATPTFSIVNSFSNQGTMVYDQNLVLDVLKLRIQTPSWTVIPEIEIIPGGCIDYLFGEECWDPVTTPALIAPSIAVNEGPVYRETHPLYSTTDNGIITGNQPSWQLAGFTPSAGAGFAFNPQYTPLASITGPGALNEGQPGTYTFTLSDADVDPATLTYTYNWGDGSAPVSGTGPVAGKTFTDTHTYADNGTYTITLTVSDTHKIQGAASRMVTVNNVTPALTYTAAGSITENSILTVTGAITDPGIRDSFTLTVNWGEGTPQTYNYPAGTTSYTVTHLYQDDNPTSSASNTYPISLTLKDKDNAQVIEDRSVVINNVAPTVFAGNNRVVDEGSPTGLGVDLFGKNLITNPNAEAGVSGWAAGNGFTTKQYQQASSIGGYSPLQAYQPQTWTRSASAGTTSISPASGPTGALTFGYNASISGLFSANFTFSNTATKTETLAFDWIYAACHSWYHTTAYADAYADGPSGRQTVVLADPPFDSPDCESRYSGRASLQVYAGYQFGFHTSGSHYDGSYLLSGYLIVYDTTDTITFVNQNTPGLYNNSIGTALDGTQTQFPAPTWVRSATLYDNPDFTGTSVTFTQDGGVPGYFNDVASSIRLGSGTTATLYEHYSYGGASKLFTSDSYDFMTGIFGCGLYGCGLWPFNLNNQVSSIRLGGSGAPQIYDPDLGTNLAQPDLGPVSGVLGGFLTTPATPGGSWTGMQVIPTTWTEYYEDAIIYPIDVPAGGAYLRGNFGVDNGVFVWVDNVYKFGAVQPGGPPATPTSFEYTNIDLGWVGEGTHYIQVLREDHGGSAAWAVKITGLVPVVHSPPASVAPGAIARWTFDGTPADVIGGRGGQNIGAVADTTGKVGGAYQFNGNGAVAVESTDDLDFGTGDFSGTAWVKTTSPNGWIIEKDVPGTGNGAWWVNATPAFITGDTAGDVNVSSSVAINDGAWHLVGWVRRANAMEVYVDGQLTGSTAVAALDVTNGDRLVIGAEEQAPGALANKFTGAVDDVVLYNRALSASEIAGIYGAFQDPGQTPTTAGPASRGQYYFTDTTTAMSTGTQTIDVSDSASVMDTGAVDYNLSGYLGGIAAEGDTATLTVTFRNASNGTISTGQIGPVTAADRANATGLLLRSASGDVPAGTRSILLTLTLARSAATSNDGAADNLSFVLLPGPGAQLSASFTDPGIQDTHATSVTWGDGIASPFAVSGIPGSYTVDGSHRYKDNGSYTVTLTDTDDDTGTDSDDFSVTVRNVAPSVTPVEQVFLLGRNESKQVASFTDPGAIDTHTALINWGDGTAATAGTVTETLSNVAGALTTGTVTGTHTYSVVGPFPKVFTATVTVTDKDGGATSIPVTITVSDLEIVMDPLNATPVTLTENGTVAFTGSFQPISFPAGATVFTPVYDFAWDFGDGSVTAPALATPGTNITTPHTYLDNGSYTATLKIRAFEGARLATYASISKTITVTNAAPAVSLSPVAAISENGSATVNGTFTDAGTLDSHTVTITWGDGSTDTVNPAVGARSFSVSHQYRDDNPTGTASDSYHIAVTVADDDSGTGAANTTVTVNNVAPNTLTLNRSATSIVENGSITLGGSFADAGTLDTHTVAIAWGDGSTESFNLAANVLTFSGKSHQWLDDNASDSYTIQVTVTDDDGGSVTGSTPVTVTNATPASLTFTVSPDEIDEAGYTGVSGMFADAGTKDAHTLAINWGDGSVVQNVALPAGDLDFSNITHQYLDDDADDSYTISVTVTDDDGASSGPVTRTVKVHDVAPTVEAGVDWTLNEGGSIALVASFEDPGALDTFTATINWGDGATQPVTPVVSDGEGSISATHTYVDNAPSGAYTVRVCVKDDDQAAPGECDTFSVQVNNLPPAVDAGVDRTAEDGQVLAFTATFSDAGALDTHTATIAWGDGATQAGVVNEGARTVTGSHAYAENGGYTVTVCVKDDESAETCDALQVAVINTAPAVDAGPDRSVAEGDVVSLAAAYSDPNLLDTHTATVNWGDSTPVETDGLNAGAHTITGSHVYANNPASGFHSVTVCVTDDDGAETCDSLMVVVSNAAPIIAASSGAETLEGTPVGVLLATFNDKGASDTHTATVDWGDGTAVEAAIVAEAPFGPPGSASGVDGRVFGSHLYVDDGYYTVALVIRDRDGATASATLPITVRNTPPQVALSGPAASHEGQTQDYTFTATDAGADTWELVAGFPKCGGSGTVVPGSLVINAAGGSFTCLFIEGPAVSDVELQAVDSDGLQSAIAKLPVTVSNLAATVDAGADQAVAEGTALSLAPATFNDQGTLDTHTATIDWGDGAAVEAGLVSEAPFGLPGSTGGAHGTVAFGTHVYADNGSYTVTACVTDDDGAETCDTLVAVVSNVAPTATLGNNAPVIEASYAKVEFSGQSDPSTADTAAHFRYAFSCTNGDLSAATYASSSTLSNKSCLFLDNGVYTVRARILDKDNGYSEYTTEVIVDNVAPAVNAGLDTTVGEGAAFTTAPAPAGWWGAEDSANDSAGGNHGTLQGDTVVGLGKIGRAFLSNGNGYVLVPDAPALRASSELTLSAWVLPIGSGAGPYTEQGGMVINKEGEYEVARFADGTIRWAFANGNPGWTWVNTGAIAPAMQWAHVTVTYANGTVKTYKNGALVHTYNGSGAIGDADPGQNELRIGSRQSIKQGFQGFIDEAMVYTRALSDAEAAALYSAGAGAAFADRGADTWSATVDYGDGTGIQPLALAGKTFLLNHVYADNGPYTVTVTVTDDDGGVGTDSAIVTVTNAAPSIDAGADQLANEGSAVTLAPSTFNDKGAADTHTATINWGDGTATDAGIVSESPFGPPGSVAGASGTIAGSHIYADNGTYVVTVTITDDDGATASDTLLVTVANVAPTVDAGADQAASEGQIMRVTTATFNDKGTNDTHTATIDWGDGSPVDAAVVMEAPFGPPGSASGANGAVGSIHVYADDGVYTVTIAVTDDDGASASDTLLLTIANVAPVVEAGAALTAGEGSVMSLDGTAYSDKGTLDSHTATIDWGDGSAVATGVVTEAPFGPPGNRNGANGTVAGSHVYADNGTYTVAVCVTDDAATTCASTTATVYNVTPTLDAGADQTAAEGNTVSLAPSAFNDRGTLDTHTATVEWGDGTVVEAGVISETPTGPAGSTAGANGTIAASHVYADDGTYTVTVTVTDDDGATVSDALVVTVGNASPTLSGGADQVANEGSAVTLAPSTFNDKGAADTHTATINWGDGTATDAGIVSESPFGPPGSVAGASGTIAGSHIYADDGTYTVTVTVTDDDGGAATDTLLVTVLNAAPTVDAGTDQTASEGALVSLAPATFNDKGTKDSHTATINWGDGTASEAGVVAETLSGPPGSTAGTDGTVAGSHVYAGDGLYTVTITVKDDDGGVTSDALLVTVTNAAPSVVPLVAQSTVAEGAVAALAPSTFNDKGTKDTHAATIDWGDGSPTEAGVVTETPFGPPGDTAGANGTVGGSHVYGDNGTYTVTVCVTDDAATTCESTSITVTNVAPIVDATAGQVTDEGSLLTLMVAAFNDKGTKDTHTATINWGDGTATEAGAVTESPFGPPGNTAGANGTVSGSHVYTDNGSYTVTACVKDDEAAETCDTFKVTVNNVAPGIDVQPKEKTIFSGQRHTVTAAFTDPSIVDTHTATVAWGDGVIEPVAVIQGTGNGSLTASHRYLVPGTYFITMTVTDDDGGNISETVSLKVDRLRVSMDIKPDSTPNSINLKSKGNVPVAVLTGTYGGVFVDATTIKRASLNFSGAPDLGIGKGSEDVDRDGDTDQTFHFDTTKVVLEPTATEAELIGETEEGVRFIAYDSVKLVPAK